MSKRNLLLCFDAFGTLFHPKQPISQQYGAVARQCGLTGFSDDDVQASFRAAFKKEAKTHPNYGKAGELGPERWWTNVIHNTFQPLVGEGKQLPSELAPRLLHRFASADGYSPASGLVTLLKALQTPAPTRQFERILVGVVSNSDDRVPSILTSLGLRISPLRYSANIDPAIVRIAAAGPFDISFHCMSYDVGFEKPDLRIFEAAEHLASMLVDANEPSTGVSTWDKVYVGDEYAKDVVGAENAGWRSFLLGDDAQVGVNPLPELQPNSDVRSLDLLFRESAAVRVAQLETLVNWLLGRG